jgi:AcrR family transcriptional regulator
MPRGSNVERQRLRNEQRRRAILEVAAEVFAEVGYDRASLDEIGARIGLSATALYYYFSSKDSIFVSLIVDAISEIEAKLAEFALATNSDTPLDWLAALVRAHVEVLCSGPAGKVIGRNHDALFAGGDMEALRTARRSYEGRLRAILDVGVKDGAFEADNTKLLTYHILAILDDVPRWYSPNGPLSTTEIAEGVFSFILTGISPRSREATSAAFQRIAQGEGDSRERPGTPEGGRWAEDDGAEREVAAAAFEGPITRASRPSRGPS